MHRLPLTVCTAATSLDNAYRALAHTYTQHGSRNLREQLRHVCKEESSLSVWPRTRLTDPSLPSAGPILSQATAAPPPFHPCLFTTSHMQCPISTTMPIYQLQSPTTGWGSNISLGRYRRAKNGDLDLKPTEPSSNRT